ncbi:MAG: chorismate mutase [Candidatus Pacearchaeota archaeon]|nr:chorismate mutase [Candidatus Pacearchaeota archaeon]
MAQIEDLREMINQVDADLLKLTEDRFEIAREIGRYKKENKLPIEDLKREKEIIDNIIKSSKLDARFVEKLFKLLFEESKRIQGEI